jgi:hypothetical protein
MSALAREIYRLTVRGSAKILGTPGLLSAVKDVYTALMKIVKYFTLVALAAATLGVSACCTSEKAPPPPPPPPPTGK